MRGRSRGSLFLGACSITAPANVVEFDRTRPTRILPDSTGPNTFLSTPQDENNPASAAHASDARPSAPPSVPPSIEVKNVAVLGAGTMGHGIAQVAAVAGY